MALVFPSITSTKKRSTKLTLPGEGLIKSAENKLTPSPVQTEERPFSVLGLGTQMKTTTPAIVEPKSKAVLKGEAFPGVVEYLAAKTKAPGLPIKLPFIQKEVVVPEGPLEGLAKFATELPEKVVTSLKEVPYVIAKKDVPEYKGKLYRVPSYAEDAKGMTSALLEQGYSPGEAITAAILQTGGQAIIDVTILSGLIERGAQTLLKQATPELEERVAAWKLMGQPKTAEELTIARQKLARQFHPDLVGDQSTPAMSRINAATDILEKGGIPSKIDVAKLKVAEKVAPLAEGETPLFTRTADGKLKVISAKELLKPSAVLKGRAKLIMPEIPLPFKQLPGYAPEPGQPAFAPGLTIKKMMPVGRPAEKGILSFDPLKSTPELENSLLKISQKGTGQFRVGEVYQQIIQGKPRPVIISKVNPDGSVDGFYMGAVSPEEATFGIGPQSLQPAKWKNPTKELEVPSYPQETIDKFTSKVFGIEKLKQLPEVPIKAPKTLQGIIKQEAEALQQVEEGLGVTTMPKPGYEGEQFIRVSEHSQPFKDFYKKNKRVPTTPQEWQEIAKTELEAGRSAIGLENEFRAIKGTIKEPVEAEIDVESLFKETEDKVMAEMPAERQVRAALITSEEKAQFLKTLSEDIQNKMKLGRGLTPAEAGRVGKIYEDFIRKGGFSERLVTMPESKLLKLRLGAERRGAITGYKAGRKDARNQILERLREGKQEIEVAKKDILEYAKEHLSPSDRGRAMTMIRDAKTQRDVIKAFTRINRWAEDIEKKTLRNEILKVQRKALESPAVSIDYKDRIKEALDDFELRGHTEKTMSKLRDIQNYINSQARAGVDVEMPQRIWNSLKILSRDSFAEIPLRTIEGVLDEVKMLEELGRRQWAVKQLRYENERDAIKEQLIAGTTPMNRIEKFRPFPGEKIMASQKMKNFIIGAQNALNKIDKVVSPIDVIFDILDGARGTYDGPNTRLIKNKIDHGFNVYLDLKDSLIDPVVDLAQKLNLKEGNYQRMGVVAAREQEGGIEKLKNLGFMELEINGIKLTPDENQLLTKMKETMDSQFPFVTEITKELYNQPVGKVKNYFSFMTDWDAMDESEVFRRMGPTVEEFGSPTKTVDMGFTKERKGAGEQKIQINAMKIFLKHIDNVAYLRSLGKETKMLFEIINSPEYAKVAGDLGQLLTLEWIDLIARKGGKMGANQIAVLDIIRKNIGAGILGLKITSSAIQWTSLVDGMGAIGPGWASRGVASISTSRQWREFVMKFPELRERAGGEYAIRELIEGNTWQKLQSKGFIPLQAIDRITAASVAAGAYQKKMLELGLTVDLTKAPNREAMEYAQLITRRTQASSLFKDVPLAISRGALTGNRSIDRALFQFQNFLLFRWSRVRHDAIRVGIETKNPIHAANVMFWITLASILATGTRMGVHRAIDFLTGKDAEDDEAKYFLKSMVFEMFGMVPFMGNIFGSYVYDSNLVPLLEVPQNMIAGAKKTIEGKSLQTKMKGATDFLTSALALLGVPGAMQAQQFIKKAIPEVKKKSGILPELPTLPTLPKLPSLPSL